MTTTTANATEKNASAVALGSIRSERKAAAARANGRRGGRPRLSLYERAERRVDRSPTLSKHKAFIMDDWPLGDEHWQWVCTARVSEIVAWVIACSD